MSSVIEDGFFALLKMSYVFDCYAQRTATTVDKFKKMQVLGRALPF